MNEPNENCRTIVLETDRLQLVHAELSDASFLYRLMNEPEWIEHIGDRGIDTVEAAEEYIESRLRSPYQSLGFGLYLILLKSEQTPLGLCGLVKRPNLDDVDIGFALQSNQTGKGYAFESAFAILNYAQDVLQIPRLVAICTQSNSRSIRLLERLGLTFQNVVKLDDDEEELRLYSVTLLSLDGTCQERVA